MKKAEQEPEGATPVAGPADRLEEGPVFPAQSPDTGQSPDTAGPAEDTPLRDLPHARGLPLLGHTLSVIRDPIDFGTRMGLKHGLAYSVNAFFQRIAILGGVDALELVFNDKDSAFSSDLGYRRLFGHIADTSLLMMDGLKHRKHRQALNPAFKAAVMQTYLARMHTVIAERIDGWAGTGFFKFYPAVKQLTLDVATDVFLGLERGEERRQVNAALTDIFGSAISVVRLPLPFTSWRRGMKAQRFIRELLLSKIPERKQREGDDVFTRLCHAVDEDGRPFSEEEILGHLMTFWVAGHDTLASSLTTLMTQLGLNPEWQERLAAEVQALPSMPAGPTMEDLKVLPLAGYAFKEALRIMPPAFSLPRGVVKETSYRGYRLPKGMQVSVGVYGVHHHAPFWPEPEKFDPLRFAPENTPKDRPRYAWAPFGGGPHKCIGMIFAEIQAKCFLMNLLGCYRVRVQEGYEPDIIMLPTPRPRDGLPLEIVADSAD